MRQHYAQGHRVSLMPPEGLANDDLVAVVSNMGAPLVGQERLFLRGTAKLDDLAEWHGRSFELAFQNELAVGWLDGVPRVMTPDLICVLDTAIGEAIGTGTLGYGHRAARADGIPVANKAGVRRAPRLRLRP